MEQPWLLAVLLPGRGVSSQDLHVTRGRPSRKPSVGPRALGGNSRDVKLYLAQPAAKLPPDFLQESLKKSNRSEAYGEKDSPTPRVRRGGLRAVLMRKVKGTISIPVVLF